MVEMVCGAYGAKERLIRPADGPFSLSTEEEKRLVERGVARYVKEAEGEPAQPPQPEAKKPPKPKNPGKGKDGEAPPDLSPQDPVT